MIRWLLARMSWPARVWAVGAIAIVTAYFVRNASVVRHTPVGVERRLFGVRCLFLRLHESPGAGRWVVVVEPEPPGSGPPPGPLGALIGTVAGFEWQPHYSPRVLAPFQPSGTWLLRGTGLKRLWRHEAQGWLDDWRLWGNTRAPSNVIPQTAVLDLRTGRTRLDDDEVTDSLRYATDDGEENPYVEEVNVEEPLAEGGDAIEASSRIGGMRQAEGRPFYLIDAKYGPGLCAARDHPAPRVLPLARDAGFVALGREARTLYFTRRGYLWRLDLRKPIPQLLDEIEAPELPDPLQAYR